MTQTEPYIPGTPASSYLNEEDRDQFELIMDSFRGIAVRSGNPLVLNIYQNLEELWLRLKGEE